MKRRNFIQLSAKGAAAAGIGVPLALSLSEGKAVASPGKESDHTDMPISVVPKEPKPLSPHVTWMREARWGVFCHYLAHMPSKAVPADMTGAAWSERVDSFDAEAFARQLSSASVPYFFLTIGQGGGYYCSPNHAYSRVLNLPPDKLSRRDLIADVAKAVTARGIRFGAYLPNVGSEHPEEQAAWQEVIREWSVRWGSLVSAWWIDGVYQKPSEYKAFTQAFKAGNPNSLIAYNTGPVSNMREQMMAPTEYQDFLAGEVDWFLPTSGFRQVEGKHYYEDSDQSGVQLHFLNFLGEWWGTGKPRFPDQLVAGWTRHINDHGGAVTWDVPLGPTGHIEKVYLDQLVASSGYLKDGRIMGG